MANLDGCGKTRPPLGFDSRIFQPLASRYTDYAIPAPVIIIIIIIINDIQLSLSNARISASVGGIHLLLIRFPLSFPWFLHAVLLVR